MHTTPHRRLSPKKLLLSKWTAVAPHNKEKHFMVIKLVEPDQADSPVELIELQAVYTQQIYQLPWRELTDTDCWLQGWH